MATVYLVTHGEKEEFDADGRPIPDPGMTERGKKQVTAIIPELKKLLPEGPSMILRGTGKRHGQVASALGFNLGETIASPIFGGPETLIKINNKELVVLANGETVPYRTHYVLTHLKVALEAAIRELPSNTLFCSGRPILVRMGMDPKDPNCQSGALYAIHVGDSGSITFELLVAGVNLLDGHGSAV